MYDILKSMIYIVAYENITTLWFTKSTWKHMPNWGIYYIIDQFMKKIEWKPKQLIEFIVFIKLQDTCTQTII